MASLILPRPSLRRTVPRVCEYCEGPFLVSPDAARRAGGRFCSKSCACLHRYGYRGTLAGLERFWSNVDKSPHPKDCWIWTGATDNRGYGKISLAGKLHSTHRLSYEWHVGPIPDGLQINHHCDNPPCLNPAHLYAGNKSRNALDAVERGQWPTGEECPWSKLTEADVLTIRRDRAFGMTLRAVAVKHGMNSTGRVSDIATGKSWKHVITLERQP